MNNITKSKVDSNIVKFQTKIRKNLELYCFSKDAVVHFAKFYKSNFKDYKFFNFASKFKNVRVKKNSEIKTIKHTEISDYGKNLIENELSNLVFVLNMSDFEAWLFEFLNIIFSSNHKILLRYLKPEKTPFNLSVLERSKNIEEIWQKIIDQYLFNKFYDRKDEMLKNLLSSCNIKMDKKFEIIIGKINENFLCRNLVVHNKNKVKEEYVIKSDKYAKFKIGETIKISEEYLFEQGDNLLFFMQSVRKILKNNHATKTIYN